MTGKQKNTDDTRTAVDETEQRLARRNLLRLGGMAAAGAAGAALLTAVDASPAAAGVDGDVVLGADNTGASARTAIIANLPDTEIGGFFQDATTGAAVRGRAGANSVAFPWDNNKSGSFGLYGESKDGVGVIGISDNGYAVEAVTDSGIGVQVGAIGSGIAVFAYSNSTTGNPAVRAASLGQGSAVVAETGGNALKPAVKSTSGAAAQAAVQANGVNANTLALDVHGKAVIATGGLTAAPALKSTSGSAQPAVQAIGKVVPVSTAVPVAGNAAALNVAGVASFTRSNVATVPAAATSVVVNVPGGLTATSHVLATMQTTTAANVGVKSATPNSATGKITIRLTAAAPTGGISVAWFVFG